jgi:hypothetical protein
MSVENSGSGEYTQLTDEEWLDVFEARAADEPTPKTELLVKARQWLVAARLAVQDPSANRFFLSRHRSLDDSPKYQNLFATRLETLNSFPEETREAVLIEQFSVIRDLLERK